MLKSWLFFALCKHKQSGTDFTGEDWCSLRVNLTKIPWIWVRCLLQMAAIPQSPLLWASMPVWSALRPRFTPSSTTRPRNVNDLECHVCWAHESSGRWGGPGWARIRSEDLAGSSSHCTAQCGPAGGPRLCSFWLLTADCYFMKQKQARKHQSQRQPESFCKDLATLSKKQTLFGLKSKAFRA